ncbi:hypothetical protein J4450_01685 [Candidatus Micrarchaeota archaeon]|nr:hypothetical protein [Candidatus Micrarchaeota archaeon]
MGNKFIVLAILFSVLLIAGCFHDKVPGGQSSATTPTPAPTPPPAQPPAQPPVQPPVQPPADIDFGISEAEFPGYTEVALPGTGKSTLQDFTEESQKVLKDYGFESVYVVVLQSPVLLEGENPDENFRELQSSVSTFATVDGAKQAFDKEIELLKANNVDFEEDVKLGEKSLYYVKVFANQNGVKLEQHVIMFLKGKRYASVSVTATEREDGSELSKLLAQTALNLAKKMPS